MRPAAWIRDLEPRDLDAVAVLEPELFGAGAWSRETYREELVRADRLYLAAEMDGELVGYAGLALEPEWNIMTIGVVPRARRKGIARQLLDALLAQARERGGKEVFLEVRSRDGGAQQLYRNAGFVPVGLRRKYYQLEGEDAVVMRLDLESGPTTPRASSSATSSSVGPVGAEAVAGAAAEVGPGEGDRSGASAPFVDVDHAHREIWSATPPVVLDVRWSLNQPDQREIYSRGHIPGATYVDLDLELAAEASAEAGRHPLPEPAAFERSIRAWGIDDSSRVLVYDDWGGLAAARAWWLLRWAGVSDVAIIDGGLRAWTSAGHHLEDGFVRRPPGSATVRAGQLPSLDADAVAEHVGRGGILLDARALERFRGEHEPIDPRGGHIPGATSMPTLSHAPDGWLLERDELLGRLAAIGVVPGADVAVYCGSGVTASHTVAVLAHVGIAAALYPGSFSQWSNDPDREVHTGA